MDLRTASAMPSHLERGRIKRQQVLPAGDRQSFAFGLKAFEGSNNDVLAFAELKLAAGKTR